MQQERPDLPELEEVKSTRAFDGSMFALAVLSAMALVIFAGLVARWLAPSAGAIHPTHIQRIYFIRLLVLEGSVAAILLFIRTYILDYSWETNSEGLRYWRWLLLSGFIPWNEVTGAETRRVNLLMGKRHVVYGNGRATAIPTSQAVLSASIWQHLRAVGKADGLTLSDEADALWTPSAYLPESADWKGGSWLVNNMGMLIFGVMLLIFWLLITTTNDVPNRWGGLVMPLAFLGSAFRGLWATRWAKAGPEKLETRNCWRTNVVRWDEIQAVRWTDFNLTLSIRINWYRSINIPWSKHNTDTNALIQCIARNLHNRPNPILLPLPGSLARADNAEKEPHNAAGKT